MSGLAILLLIAAAGFGLAERFRMPLVPLLMLPGMAVSALGLSAPADALKTALELGLTFLVFTSGMELDPRRFQQRTGAVLAVGLVQFAVAAFVGYAAARLLGIETINAMYLACALSTSSTLVVLRHLRRAHQMFEPFGRLVTGVLLLQDLLVILLIIALARVSEGAWAVTAGVGKGIGVFLLAWVLQRWVFPQAVTRFKLDEETLLVCVLAVLFVFVGLAHLVDLPLIAGGFFAGFALSGFPVNGVSRGLLGSFATFFVALFFTSLGSVVSVPDAVTLGRGILLAGLVVLVTPPAVTIVAEWKGVASRQAIESGLLIAQTSEFSLVLALSGLVAGQISTELFTIVALVAVITMSLTPLLATERVTDFLLRLHPFRLRTALKREQRDHVLILGFGTAGIWVVKPLRDSGHAVVVVDDDPVVIHVLEKVGVPWIHGDGSDEKVLAEAGAASAKLIIASMRRVSSAKKVLRHVHGVPVLVRVFEATDADEIRKLGGIPVMNSHASADSFMEWFEKTVASGA